MKQFNAAARRGTSTVTNPIPITFEFEVRAGEYIEMTAQPPTTGQIALLLTHQSGGVESVEALFDFLASTLTQPDFDIIEKSLQDGMDLDLVFEIVQYLTSEWGSRPTQPPSASSASPRNGGKRSTAKQPSTESTS